MPIVTADKVQFCLNSKDGIDLFYLSRHAFISDRKSLFYDLEACCFFSSTFQNFYYELLQVFKMTSLNIFLIN